jgi:hypothetical protein
MSRHGRVAEWYRFFGVRNPEEAAGELHRLVVRLDDTYDQLAYLTKILAGSPSADAEEDLRMARISVNEVINLLTNAMKQLRSEDPDAA